MSDAFMPRHSSPEYSPPHHSAPHHPSPHHPSTSYPTYPWQPPPAQPVRRRQPPRPPLGNHSDLRILRTAYRLQRRVATLTALGYFTLFLLMSAFAPSFMTRTVSGGLSMGLLLGLLQVPVTCLAIGLYEYTARHTVDPIADRLRRQATTDARREATR
ncbi:DUF485 domain-containing protein [Streptomyces yaanensis]|uniref:DUF485 domain-containing protein n=1 Tax=Streptomyces yaanensis TaxID=1142239 RepID=A0ABV7SAT7_9ACTN|nr:DUF485 domain-containing protein [Streptomyces sp. CGMCC 4.7035]WNC02344.1 DUF485 domain-containing protein [Streptomyces sp. CGMCC 4.7035]